MCVLWDPWVSFSWSFFSALLVHVFFGVHDTGKSEQRHLEELGQALGVTSELRREVRAKAGSS